MHEKDELVSDVGSVLIGKEAVDYGLIDEVGGLKEALKKLRELIKESEEEKIMIKICLNNKIYDIMM